MVLKMSWRVLSISFNTILILISACDMLWRPIANVFSYHTHIKTTNYDSDTTRNTLSSLEVLLIARNKISFESC
jgi:hypothetical protein